jgi:mono/diheme cytochrome c family protein
MRTRYIVLILVAFGIVGPAAWALTRSAGFSAREEPSMAEHLIARATRRLAIPRGARRAQSPLPSTPEVWSEGRAHFADHCAVCHGNDGRGNTEIGRNLYPKVPDMRLPDTQRLTDGELYWIIENGVRLTGMPAWGTGTGDDADTWKLVHFVRRLTDLTEEDLREMEALNPRSPAELEEERQDREFLEGKDVAPPLAAPAQPHQHREKP